MSPLVTSEEYSEWCHDNNIPFCWMCGKPPVFLVDVIIGDRKTYTWYLCDECYNSSKIHNFLGFEVLGSPKLLTDTYPTEDGKKRTCQNCHYLKLFNFSCNQTGEYVNETSTCGEFLYDEIVSRLTAEERAQGNPDTKNHLLRRGD